jgi:hypothetical protein
VNNLLPSAFFGLLLFMPGVPRLNGDEDFKPLIALVLRINDNFDIGQEEVEAIATLTAEGSRILPDLTAMYITVELRLRGGLLDMAMNCEGGERGELLRAVRLDLGKVLANGDQNNADLVNFMTSGIEFVSREGTVQDHRLVEEFLRSERSPVRAVANRALEEFAINSREGEAKGMKRDRDGHTGAHGNPMPQPDGLTADDRLSLRGMESGRVPTSAEPRSFPVTLVVATAFFALVILVYLRWRRS